MNCFYLFLGKTCPEDIPAFIQSLLQECCNILPGYIFCFLYVSIVWTTCSPYSVNMFINSFISVWLSVLPVTLTILLFLGSLFPWCRLFQRAPISAATACNGPDKELPSVVPPENCQFPLAWTILADVQPHSDNLWKIFVPLWKNTDSLYLHCDEP